MSSRESILAVECLYLGNRNLHRRPGGGQPRLQRHQQRYASAEVLLSARSDGRPVCLFQRARLYSTAGCRLASFSINNTYLVGSNLSTQETLGYLREKLYNTNEQPSDLRTFRAEATRSSIDTFGSNYFPGISIIHVLGNRKTRIRRHPEYRRRRRRPGIPDGRLPESPTAIRECNLGKRKTQYRVWRQL